MSFIRAHPLSLMWGIYACISVLLYFRTDRYGGGTDFEFIFFTPLLISAKPLMPLLSALGLVSGGSGAYLGAWPTPGGFALTALIWFALVFLVEYGVRRVIN